MLHFASGNDITALQIKIFFSKINFFVSAFLSVLLSIVSLTAHAFNFDNETNIIK